MIKREGRDREGVGWKEMSRKMIMIMIIEAKIFTRVQCKLILWSS